MLVFLLSASVRRLIQAEGFMVMFKFYFLDLGCTYFCAAKFKAVI